MISLNRSLFFGSMLTCVISVTFCTAALGDTKTTADGFLSFDHDGTKREYVLHLPDDLPENSPLVLFLHGYRGDARDYAEMGFSRVANEKKFAVAYPQGLVDFRGITHWNARLKLSRVDDVGFLKSLVEHLQSRRDLDPARTFVSGVSNGGFMSYTMISEQPDSFRAAASIIGTVSGETWKNRDQMQPRPVLQISGLSDRVVPVDGSMSKLGGWGGAPNQKEIIRFFCELNQTKKEEVISVSPRVKAIKYLDGVEGNEVWHYEVKNWGHRVPGAKELGVHSVDLVWEFFSRF